MQLVRCIGHTRVVFACSPIILAGAYFKGASNNRLPQLLHQDGSIISHGYQSQSLIADVVIFGSALSTSVSFC